MNGTDPTNTDSDGDGQSDYEEVYTYGSDPTDPDDSGEEASSFPWELLIPAIKTAASGHS